MSWRNRPGLRRGDDSPGGRTAHRGIGWTAAVLILGAGSVALTLFFRNVEGDALRAQTQMAVVSDQLDRQDGLEWRAISGRVPLHSIRAHLNALRAQTTQALDQAESEGLSRARADTLGRLAEEYETAVDTELTVLAHGKPRQAKEFDEATVDPAYKAMRPEITAATAELADEGRRAGLISLAGLIGTFAVALSGVRFLERRRQESSRRAERLSEARYRALVDRSNDYVLVVGPQAQLWYASPAAERAGLAAPSVRLVDLVHPDDRAKAARLTSGSADDTTETAELRLRHVDLGWRTCEVSVTVLSGDVGHENVIVAHDVTDRAQEQEAVSRARDEAVEASRVKSMFLATMSHEIRTPMNGVIGMTSLLLDTDLDVEQRDYAQVIRASGESLLAVINDILDFSKIEAGQLELEDQPFVLTDCVEDALDVVGPLAAGKGLELLYESQDGCPAAVLGDVTRLRQVLVNLLSNAIKFTATGEVVVRVGCEGATDPGVVHFTVADQGIGIPPDRMDRLFQPFSQVDASITRTHGGTGLGLAISRRLVDAMGGSLWAESEVGRGSVFHVTARLPVTEPPPRPEEPVTWDLRGRRALVVDDSDNNRRILGHRLASWGITNRDSGDPSAALDWVRAGERFDVAILDMHMPDTDGVTLAAQLRATPTGTRLPLILLSSLGDRPSATDAALFAAVLTKPVKPSVLYDALADAVAAPNLTDRDGRLQPAGDQSGRAGTATNGTRVLLAEDNIVNQKVALMMLDRLGYRADVAGNGLEVLQALQRQRYHIVLMDVQMPELDGLEATRRIRGDIPADQQPYIIAMTANAFAEDRDRCIQAGMDDYVSKPVRKDILQAALQRAPATP
jgi:PAS domain S-box-containing protein